MYKVTGKQRFGAVYQKGKQLASFEKGVAMVSDPKTADALKKLGYTVVKTDEETGKDLTEHDADTGT
ncbi:MAG: hypothetical protein ACI4PM_00585 [Butyricicoccus sp.]